MWRKRIKGEREGGMGGCSKREKTGPWGSSVIQGHRGRKNCMNEGLSEASGAAWTGV